MNEDQAVRRRRASVASSNVFIIGNNVREAGSDYFRKIPRSNQVAGLIRNAGTSQNNVIQNPVSVDTSGASTSQGANNNWPTTQINDEPQYQDIEYLDESDEDFTDVNESNAIVETVEINPNAVAVVATVPFEEEHLYLEDDETWCIDEMFAEGDF